MPPSAFFREIGSSSRCRGPLFQNRPTKPEQTRAAVQGSHASPRLASQTSFAWLGLLSARVPPATPGLPFLPPPLPSGPARSPGLGILGQLCMSPRRLDARVQDVLQEQFCLWTSQAGQ